jgi:hypothetical protein
MTLVELLVVMMIIATLASLVLSAVFTVREAQMKSFTESLVNKLASAIDQQWKATVDQIRDEPVPAAFLALAWGDVQRARVLYTKARLAQEYPVTFDQAVNPMPGYLTAKTAFAGLPASSAATQPLESSVLLALTLSQSRRGMSGFSLEQIEPTAQKSWTNPANGKSYVYLVDSWGNPLRYYAFPYYNDELNDPTLIHPYTQGQFSQNQPSPDPQDADKRLRNYSPTLAQSPQQAAFATAFATYVHPLDADPTPDPFANNKTGLTLLRYMIPVVASSGRDGDFGDELGAGNLPTRNALMWMRLNRTGINDNIYSYRLRQFGQRGD